MENEPLFSEEDVVSINKYIRNLPLVGIVSSMGILCVEFFKNTPWSIYSIFLNIIPLIFSLVLYFSIIIWRHRKSYKKLSFSTKRKIVYILFLVALVVLNVCLYNFKNVKFR